MTALRLWAAAWALWAAAADPAAAERLVADVSQNRIAITADFDGTELFVYGAVARDAPPDATPPAVVVRIAGPPQDLVVRRKSNRFGVWVNTERERVAAAPSYYAVASTGSLADALTPSENLTHRVALEHALDFVSVAGVDMRARPFREAVLRLRRDAGLYDLAPGGVTLTDGVLFRASFVLPANIVEGRYAVTVFLTRDGLVIDRIETEIDVAKAGLERLLFDLSRRQPLIYGLIAIAVALSAGLAASELFRWLRR